MFEVGDYVVHGVNGVCRVDGIEDMPGAGGKRVCYVMTPLYTSGSKVFVPTDSKKVITRAVITKNEAQELISHWEEIDELSVESDKKREETYKAALRSCDTWQWASLIKTSHHRNIARLKQGKKITTSDERYLQMAEDNFFGELAIPLELSKQEAQTYFIQCVQRENEQ